MNRLEIEKKYSEKRDKMLSLAKELEYVPNLFILHQELTKINLAPFQRARTDGRLGTLKKYTANNDLSLDRMIKGLLEIKKMHPKTE